MKKTIRYIPGIILIFLFLCNTALADGCKIAVIEYQRCLKESEEGKRVFKDLQVKHAALKKKLDEKQLEVLELKKSIEKQGSLLNPEAKAEKQKVFERESRELEYLLKDLSDEMKELEFKAKKRIENDIQEIVNQIAKNDKIDLVREKKSVAQDIWFVSDEIDITDRVIEEYNKLKP